jgi:hypothetical protein
MLASIRGVLMFGHVGHFAYHLIDCQRRALCVALGYIVATDPEPATDAQFVLACGVLTLLALNFFYVLLANRTSNWRALRVIGLWFDAKVSELRQRADRPRQDK